MVKTTERLSKQVLERSRYLSHELWKKGVCIPENASLVELERLYINEKCREGRKKDESGFYDKRNTTHDERDCRS